MSDSDSGSDQPELRPFDPAAYSLRVEWEDGTQPTECRLSDAEMVRQMILENGRDPAGFESDCPSLADILEALTPLASVVDWENAKVNGVQLVEAESYYDSKVRGLVPHHDEDVVDWLGEMEDWVDGNAPVVWVTLEYLLAMEDLYWIVSGGEGEGQVHCILGRFADPHEGRVAMAAASAHFDLDEDGWLVERSDG